MWPSEAVCSLWSRKKVKEPFGRFNVMGGGCTFGHRIRYPAVVERIYLRLGEFTTRRISQPPCQSVHVAKRCSRFLLHARSWGPDARRWACSAAGRASAASTGGAASHSTRTAASGSRFHSKIIHSNNGEMEFLQPQNLMRQRIFISWGIQTETSAPLLGPFIREIFHLFHFYTGRPILITPEGQ